MLPTDRIKIEIRKVPQSAAVITVNLPKAVPGTTSPYPTVVIVIITQYTEVKQLSHVITPSAYPYGHSNILRIYARTNAENNKTVITVYPGELFKRHLKVNLTFAVKPYDLQSFLLQMSINMVQLKSALRINTHLIHIKTRMKSEKR